MTRAKYESLPLATLRELAKARKLKGVSALKKAELIDRMLEEDEKDELKKQEEVKMMSADFGHKSGSVTSGRSERAINRRNTKDNRSNTERSQQQERAQTERVQNQERSQSDRERVQNQERTQSDRERTQNQERTQSDRERVQNQESLQNDHQQSAERTSNEKTTHDIDRLDSGEHACGILEVMADGYGFIRSDNYLPGDQDIYVAPSQIRKFNLKTGHIIEGNVRVKTQSEKFSALLYLTKIDGMDPMKAARHMNFDQMTPIFPDERLRLETGKTKTSMRIMDLMAPIGKGQRGMIVSPPKAGKTTLLKEVALSVRKNNPEVHLLILLIDERPEEVTDIKESIGGDNVEVIYSTFDETPEHHKRVAEMVIERAKRLTEHNMDVMILLDSITRLARAYNLTVTPSGRTLSGGLDPAALHPPKKFFGAARNMREGGSLTILATALVDTGSKMDDVVYEEFKGTGNMELVLDRKLSERRMFPAIDIVKSGTRREDLLLTREELTAVNALRRRMNGMKAEDAVEDTINLFSNTRNNSDLVREVLSKFAKYN